MIKTLGVLVGGIFVGAAGAEIVRRKYPKALDKAYAKTREVVSLGPEMLGKLYTKTCEVASQAKESFKNGYENATKLPTPETPAAEPSV